MTARAARRLAFAASLVIIAGAREARAQDAGVSVGGCVETLPNGATRPEMTDTFPARGTSGYASVLRVEVRHGKGEKVLPNGLSLQTESESAKALKEAHFVIPHQDGGAAATLATQETGDKASTVLELPLVPLAPKPGRHTLVLPPIPIAVARASGELAVVCTAPHTVIVEDPTASVPHAMPEPNPEPRPQREDWTAMRRAVQWGSIGAAFALAVGLFAWWWSRRPKPVPPPPPPRPPWEVALERLSLVRREQLLEQGRLSEYFDRVSDSLRWYLGARFDFDGLESTTDEILFALRRAPEHEVPLTEITAFLQECDLVKFARVTPSPEQCVAAYALAESIIQRTTPYLAKRAQTPAQPRGPEARP